MKFLASLALLAATVSAGPVASRAPKKFTLKTSGAKNDAHNDLYLYSYHTGAGLSDAVFSDGTAHASHVYLNGTEALVDLGNDFSWGIIANADTSYSNWESIEINAGASQKGYSIDNGNFVRSQENGFGGWLVCDWVHDAPQLFYINKGFDGDVPSSCDKVDLKPEY